MFRRFAPLALFLFAAPALAQGEAPAPPPAMVHVVIQTSEGAIALELEKDRAPLTTANFLRYVDQKRLDGTVFYRAMKVDEGFGLIQGGTQNDPKRILKPVAHEPTTQTGLKHVTGTISMARYDPGSATGDFFITVGDIASLDANPGEPGDNLGFAAFGHVTAGMEIVTRVLDSPISTTKGEGSMKGQLLEAPVKILSVRRAD